MDNQFRSQNSEPTYLYLITSSRSNYSIGILYASTIYHITTYSQSLSYSNKHSYSKYQSVNLYDRNSSYLLQITTNYIMDYIIQFVIKSLYLIHLLNEDPPQLVSEATKPRKNFQFPIYFYIKVFINFFIKIHRHFLTFIHHFIKNFHHYVNNYVYFHIKAFNYFYFKILNHFLTFIRRFIKKNSLRY